MQISNRDIFDNSCLFWLNCYSLCDLQVGDIVNNFNPGDRVVFIGFGDWIESGTEGVVIEKVNSMVDVDSYVVALDGITPNNPNSKGIQVVHYDIVLKDDFLTPIEQYILENEDR